MSKSKINQEKFNLSGKIVPNENEGLDLDKKYIEVEDVKEFIRLEFELIEMLNNREINFREFLERRKKLAGKSLI